MKERTQKKFFSTFFRIFGFSDFRIFGIFWQIPAYSGTFRNSADHFRYIPAHFRSKNRKIEKKNFFSRISKKKIFSQNMKKRWKPASAVCRKCRKKWISASERVGESNSSIMSLMRWVHDIYIYRDRDISIPIILSCQSLVIHTFLLWLIDLRWVHAVYLLMITSVPWSVN